MQRVRGPQPPHSNCAATRRTLQCRHARIQSDPSLPDRLACHAGGRVCRHTDLHMRTQRERRVGIVVNRPISLTLGEMFDRSIFRLHQPGLEKMPVYFGGPVQTTRLRVARHTGRLGIHAARQRQTGADHFQGYS